MTFEKPRDKRSIADLARELIAAYEEIQRTTATMLGAVDTDTVQLLEAMVDERAAQVDQAEQLVNRLAPHVDQLPAALRDALHEQIAAVVRQDEQLRTAFSARAHALPQQLAEVRSTRSVLSRFGLSAPGGPSLVDRRG